jgi:hypothetical protein
MSQQYSLPAGLYHCLQPHTLTGYNEIRMSYTPVIFKDWQSSRVLYDWSLHEQSLSVSDSTRPL